MFRGILRINHVVAFPRTRIFRKGWLAPVLPIVRNLTSSETAAALRPFYFVVHPDLFGQHPKERKVNEDSLKGLHEYVTSLQFKGTARPTHLTFYVRSEDKDDLSCVRLKLFSTDLRETIITVLQSVQLPVEYLDAIPEVRGQTLNVKWDPTYYVVTGKKNPNQEYYERTIFQKSLSLWLQENIKKVHENEKKCAGIKKEIRQLEKELVASIGLHSLTWHSHWGVHHCMGCLQTFSKIYRQDPEKFNYVLKGRKLAFSNKSGVNMLGEILLSTEEVPTDWIKSLSRIEAYDAVLARLPYMENRLSYLLNNIKIVRRHGDHTHLAEEYELLLNKLLNSLRRSQDIVGKLLSTKKLSHLEMVVEGEAAPLTLSATGQFLIPASLPGHLVVGYISDHEREAYLRLQDEQLNSEMEKTAITTCQRRLNLSSLVKEGIITPEQMTTCCERLMNDAIYLEQYFDGCHLRIANYYTVNQDGEICIPWDWISDVS